MVTDTDGFQGAPTPCHLVVCSRALYPSLPVGSERGRRDEAGSATFMLAAASFSAFPSTPFILQNVFTNHFQKAESPTNCELAVYYC